MALAIRQFIPLDPAQFRDLADRAMARPVTAIDVYLVADLDLAFHDPRLFFLFIITAIDGSGSLFINSPGSPLHNDTSSG